MRLKRESAVLLVCSLAPVPFAVLGIPRAPSLLSWIFRGTCVAFGSCCALTFVPWCRQSRTRVEALCHAALFSNGTAALIVSICWPVVSWIWMLFITIEVIFQTVFCWQLFHQAGFAQCFQLAWTIVGSGFCLPYSADLRAIFGSDGDARGHDAGLKEGDDWAVQIIVLVFLLCAGMIGVGYFRFFIRGIKSFGKSGGQRQSEQNMAPADVDRADFVCPVLPDLDELQPGQQVHSMGANHATVDSEGHPEAAATGTAFPASGPPAPLDPTGPYTGGLNNYTGTGASGHLALDNAVVLGAEAPQSLDEVPLPGQVQEHTPYSTERSHFIESVSDSDLSLFGDVVEQEFTAADDARKREARHATKQDILRIPSYLEQIPAFRGNLHPAFGVAEMLGVVPYEAGSVRSDDSKKSMFRVSQSLKAWWQGLFLNSIQPNDDPASLTSR